MSRPTTPTTVLDALDRLIEEADPATLPNLAGALAARLAVVAARIVHAAAPAAARTESPRLLTMVDVAALLKVPVEHARELGRRGDIPTVTVGRRLVRVRPQALEAWIRTRERRQA